MVCWEPSKIQVVLSVNPLAWLCFPVNIQARLGPLSEYTLRLLEKQGKLPCIHTGRKCLVNYDRLLEMLGGLGA